MDNGKCPLATFSDVKKCGDTSQFLSVSQLRQDEKQNDDNNGYCVNAASFGYNVNNSMNYNQTDLMSNVECSK